MKTFPEIASFTEFFHLLTPQPQTGFETRTAWLLSEVRKAEDRKAHVTDRRFTFRKGIEYEGTLSEFASCKWLNVYPDFSTHPRAGTPDFIYLGKTGDAKHSSPKNHTDISPWSIAGHKTQKDGEFYVFTWGKPPLQGTEGIIYVCGWLPWEEIVKHKRPNITNNPNAKVDFYYSIEFKDLMRGKPWA